MSRVDGDPPFGEKTRTVTRCAPFFYVHVFPPRVHNRGSTSGCHSLWNTFRAFVCGGSLAVGVGLHMCFYLCRYM